MRTALALVVTGVAITAVDELLVLEAAFVVLAVCTCALGAVVAVSAIVRWAAVERAFRLQRPMPGLGAALGLVAAVVLLEAVGLTGSTMAG